MFESPKFWLVVAIGIIVVGILISCDPTIVFTVPLG